MGSIIVYLRKLNIRLYNQSNKQGQTNRGSALILWTMLFYFCIHTTSLAYNSNQHSSEKSYKITLSADVKEALDNGITLTFDCEIKTEKKIWFLTLPQNQLKYNFILTHHSLSNRYLVHYTESQPPKNFGSASEATDFISEQSIKLLNQYASQQSDAKMRLSLNKFKLLGPMRLNAFIAKQWSIDTGWGSWSSEI